jgi:hypothetical protein
MQAVRKIITPQSEDLIIKIPPEFKNKKIEIIISPFYEENNHQMRRERLLKIYQESRGILPEGYKFNREEAHAR